MRKPSQKIAAGKSEPANARRKAAILQPLKPASRKQAKSPRSLTIGTGSIVSVLILIILLGAWGAGMTVMLLFGDRLSERLIAQTSEMQEAYEQRLQAYRAEIARIVQEMEQSRFDQTSVEGRVVDLGRRQRLIEARLQALNRISEFISPGASALPQGSTTNLPGGRGGAPVPEPASKNGPSGAPTLSSPPAGGGGKTNRGSLDEPAPRIQLAQLGGAPAVIPAPSESEAEIDAFIKTMDRSLARADQMQSSVLVNLVRLSQARVDGFRLALRDIGTTPEAIVSGHGRPEAPIPGLVIPISDQGGPFGERIQQIKANFAVINRLKYAMDALPIFKPTIEEVRYSSGFGYRKHPILGYMKLHAGIDMAAPIGTPVRAAGSGVVRSAGWGGGYGNLIQIDHGNGLISRYAHLSEIDVVAGQPIAAGIVIGKMGTTGASTGSHLHFETRIDNAPQNPACFMIAGDHLTGRHTMLLPCETPPAWKRSGKDEEEDDDS